MTTNYKDVPELCDYIYMVENGGKKGLKKVCLYQKKLVKFVKKVFESENLTINTEQLHNYMKLEKYFDFELFPWEKFVFTLHCCVYREDGLPRFPDLLIFVGRGAGKNGYLAFEDFALISPYNGIPNYDIDICATAEEQARTSFDDIYNVLEKNRKKLIRHFHWTKSEIQCRKTRSKIKYRTNNAKSKDGLRSGKVDFDEVHAFESYDNIKVFTTALGKKPQPRMTYTTTNGDVYTAAAGATVSTAAYMAEGAAAYTGEPEIVEKEVEKRTWTEDELNNMTVAQIEGLAAYMRYTVEGSNKPEKIASFLAAQTAAGNN